MVDMKSNVSFACQCCLQPLRLDPKIYHHKKHTATELLNPIQQVVGELEPQSGSMEYLVPPFKLTESTNGTNGFMLVGDCGEIESLSHHLKIQENQCDIISSSNSADYPLCNNCTDSLLLLLDQQLRMTEGECSDYNEYLKKLEIEQQQQSHQDIEMETLTKELQDVWLAEKKMINELEALMKEEMATRNAIVQQERDNERVYSEEQRYYRKYSRYKYDLILAEDECHRLECQLTYATSQLEKLKRTNVFNATFHIWHLEHFGTINSFRLGRLPSASVDWSEINAAWGQTTLLLSALARKMNFTFKRFRLVPFGNHSYIETLDQQRALPLYGSGGFKFVWDMQFDTAMVAFLDCLQQFKEQVEKSDSGFCLPYRMKRGKIEDSATKISYSIKIQFNSEEQWTKALKFLLTNLKWGLVWIISQFTNDDTEH
ncbi:beclin-1-like protein [Megalopta genalis]|uniref:beclin-1-like protein n=1 Tax=Megalopta genalis TaxID=115081 RepID=UPI003FD438A6